MRSKAAAEATEYLQNLEDKIKQARENIERGAKQQQQKHGQSTEQQNKPNNGLNLPSLDDILQFIQSKQPQNTSATYKSRQRVYENYCAEAKCQPYSSNLNEFTQSVAGLLIQMHDNDKAASTMKTTVAAIFSKYRLTTNDKTPIPPLIKKTLDVAATTSAKSSPKSKTALSKQELMRIGKEVEKKQEESKWVRDWALILIMYHGILRESEVVSIKFDDIKMLLSQNRIDIQITDDKTSNSKKKKGLKPGKTVTILRSNDKEVCPITWLEKYLATRKLSENPYLFQTVNKTSKRLANSTPNHIVKRAVTLIQLDPSTYGSHSLRSGATTEAINRGVSREDVRKQGGWSANSTTIEKYIQDDEKARIRTATALSSTS